MLSLPGQIFAESSCSESIIMPIINLGKNKNRSEDEDHGQTRYSRYTDNSRAATMMQLVCL